MSNKEVIEKLEDAYRRVRKIGPDAIYETELREVLRAATDALEAQTGVRVDMGSAVGVETQLAARQPTEEGEYIIRLIDTIKRTGGSVEIRGVKIMPCDEYGCTAAVPDAANEAGRWHLLYEKGVEKRVELRAERDAALAAVERVRAEASSVLLAETDPLNDWNRALDYLAKRIIAALDGAPEPEEAWEYGRVYFDEAGDPHIRETTDVTSPDGHRADGSPYWNYRPMRRRKAGPWLPVGGESKP